MLKRYIFGLIFGILFLLSSVLLFAGNPIGLVSQQIPREGQPWIWKGPTIPYWPDRGSLGYLPNRTAKNLVSQAFRRWSDACSSINFQERDGIFEDITGANFRDYLGKKDGISPIIFDNDRQILRALGFPKEVLGFSSPEFIDLATGYVTEGFSIINTDSFDWDKNDGGGELDEKYLEALLVHEFGHYIGLGHSQVNGNAFFNRRPLVGFAVPPENMVETMYPILLPSQSTLKYDDIVTVNWLYPAAGFLSNSASFHGKVVQPDSVREVQGVNVIARNVNTINDPLAVYRDAVSQISGVGFHPDIFAPAFSRGEFLLSGIPPMTPMRIEIESLGSGEFPVFQIPDPLSIIPEFYNSIDESYSNPPDDPSDATILILPQRERREILFMLNQPIYLTEVNPASVPSHSDAIITIRGNGFIPNSRVNVSQEISSFSNSYPLIYDDPMKVRLVLPYDLAVGRYQLRVVRPPGGRGNESLNSVLLEVTPGPMSITSVSPAQVLYNSNEQVQVRGSNFFREMRVLLLHQQHGYQVSVAADALTPGLLTFYVPAEAVVGQYDLRLSRPPSGPGNETASLPWRVLPNTLSITNISPSIISDNSGDTVILRGNGFTNHSYVRITASRSLSSWDISPFSSTATELKFALPPALSTTGLYSIIVIRPPGDTDNVSNKITLDIQWVPPTTTTTLYPPTTIVTTTMIPTSTTTQPSWTTTTAQVSTSTITTPTTSSSSTTSSTLFNLNPFGQVETPSHGATVSNIIPISGWAVDDHGQVKITLLVDGIPDNTAVTRHLRPDIAALFPQFPNSDTSGFRIDFNTTKLPDGFHQLSVLFQDRFGATSLSGVVLIYVLNHP